MVASMARPVARTCRTASRLRTGSAPGSPRQTGHVRAFGWASAGSLAQPQNIFDAVRSWTWISMPMTASRSTAAGAATPIRGTRTPSDGGEEALDAPQRLLQLGVRRCQRRPHVPLTSRSEGAARDDRDAVLEEQSLAEHL